MPTKHIEYPHTSYQRAKTYERTLLRVRTHLLHDQLTPEEFKVLETTLENLLLSMGHNSILVTRD